MAFTTCLQSFWEVFYKSFTRRLQGFHRAVTMPLIRCLSKASTMFLFEAFRSLLQGVCKDLFLIRISQGFHKVFTRCSQGCYDVFTRLLTRLSQGFYKVFTQLLECFHNVFRRFLQGVYKVFRRCFTRLLQGCYKVFTRPSQGVYDLFLQGFYNVSL